MSNQPSDSHESTLDLTEVRDRITAVDQQLIHLLAERRHLSGLVAESKLQTGKKLRDIEREKALLTRLLAYGMQHHLDDHYVLNLFNMIIADSIDLQQQILQRRICPTTKRKHLPVSYLGPQGTYSYLAMKRYFQDSYEMVSAIPCTSFREVIRKVEREETDFGVLPIENTSSGSINEVFDELQSTSLSIVGEIIYPINHTILATKGTELSDITTLVTHEQPFTQCSEYLVEFPQMKPEFVASTKTAIDNVLEANSNNIAAIGNKDIGEESGLISLAENIANQSQNETRFIIVSRDARVLSPQVTAKTTLTLKTGQRSGALVDALSVFKSANLIMTKLTSRPIIGKPWEEMFYIDIFANAHSREFVKITNQLATIAEGLDILGCYPSATQAPVTLEDIQSHESDEDE